MNQRDSISRVIVTCLMLAAIGGFGGAISCEARKSSDCSRLWTAAITGSLMAATTGGTLLAQLEDRRRVDDRTQNPRRPDQDI